jgi:twinkle protein
MTSAAEVVQRLGARKTADGWMARCPAHDDQTASLSIGSGDGGKILLHCFAGCDTATVAERIGVSLAGEVVQIRSSHARQPIAVYEYRDESGAVLYEVVRFEPKDFRQRRTVGGEYVWKLGDVRRVLYRLPEVLASESSTPVFVVEGEKDADALASRGFVATSSVGGAGKWKWRAEYSESLRARDVILLPDNDTPGREHMQQVAASLDGVARSVRTVELPNLPPKGDVSDFFARGGTVEDFRAAVWPPKETNLVRIRDIATKLEDLWTAGIQPGVSTGWPSLDKHFTVRKKEFTVVTGIPGHGKSSWLDALLINLARLHGWRCGLFSAENLPVERHVAALLERFCGIPFGKPSDSFRMSAENVAAGLAFLDQHFTIIQPKEEGQNLASLMESMRQLVEQGVDAIVCDPWNEIDHAVAQGQTETDYIDQSLRRLRRFARTHDVHLFIVVHPAKLAKDKDGNYPVPTLYDCHGSVHWRNKADNGIVIWRDVLDGRNLTYVHVQKIRFREVGSIGVAELRYQSSTGRYVETTTDQPTLLGRSDQRSKR